MMGVTITETPALPAALAEFRAFLRVTVSDEDALLSGLLRAAADLCEAFTGRALIARDVEELIPAASGWTRLTQGPVRAIESVAAFDEAGMATPLEAGAYSTDIDAAGEGSVRVRAATGARRLSVAYRVGMAEGQNGVPEMIRHGIIRLAAHYYLRREEKADGELPSAVTALWRPWRRLRLK
jgi:uncharacterized phiE125 gp8 family phage protein